MTQFKDKSSKQRELISAGLFLYPVLMAADVLVYNAHEVPVGEDQRQHVELMREIAIRFNSRFGDTFVVPEPRIPEFGAKIMDLQSPEGKMSTTASTEQGTLYVLDDEKAIAKKIKSAVTDSGTDVRTAPDKPGISNLIEVMAVIRDVDHAQIEREFEGQQYGAFKQAVADEVTELLRPVRERYDELRPDEEALQRTLLEGAEKARALASVTLADVRDKMGVGTA
jgi:tryptophanyl-tRNA synthetase